MTARVTTLKGPGAGAYYLEALPSYYLDADEPPGRWHGHSADQLGLRGEIRGSDLLDVMAGIHPASRGVLLGQAYGESSVRGFDITANTPKSVSLRSEHPCWGPRTLLFQLEARRVDPLRRRSSVYPCLVRYGLVEPKARRPQESGLQAVGTRPGDGVVADGCW